MPRSDRPLQAAPSGSDSSDSSRAHSVGAEQVLVAAVGGSDAALLGQCDTLQEGGKEAGSTWLALAADVQAGATNSAAVPREAGLAIHAL